MVIRSQNIKLDPRHAGLEQYFLLLPAWSGWQRRELTLVQPAAWSYQACLQRSLTCLDFPADKIVLVLIIPAVREVTVGANEKIQVTLGLFSCNLFLDGDFIRE